VIDCTICGLPRWAHWSVNHLFAAPEPRDLPDAPAHPVPVVERVFREERNPIEVVSHEIKLDPDTMHGAGDQFPGNDYPW
jgi:hypothetical protein